MPIRVILIDDHPTFLQIARRFLASQPTIEIVGEASQGEDVFSLLNELEPDVVITDLAMPGVGGMLVIEKLHKDYPHIGIVALTLFDTNEHRRAATSAGAHSFVAKAILHTDLPDAIKAAVAATKDIPNS